MNGLSPQVVELITSAFDSVESLEIVMLLRRSPDTFWGPPAVAEQLGIPLEVTRTKLEALLRRGVLTVGEQTGAFRYAPAAAIGGAIDELSVEYTERRANVINAIYSARLGSLRAFSDAFRVK